MTDNNSRRKQMALGTVGTVQPYCTRSARAKKSLRKQPSNCPKLSQRVVLVSAELPAWDVMRDRFPFGARWIGKVHASSRQEAEKLAAAQFGAGVYASLSVKPKRRIGPPPARDLGNMPARKKA